MESLNVSGSPLRELASGVDALYLSGQADLPATLLADCEHWRTSAADSGGQETDLLGERFVVAPHGWLKYSYSLQHEFGRLGLTASKQLPAIRVQPLTTHLHAVGPRAAVDWWAELLDALAGPVALSVSRLDLYSDWQGWHLEASDEPCFVSRATGRTMRIEGADFTGFEFGRRTTKTVVARIYDKTRQVSVKGLDWWHDLWGPSFDPAERVFRVEFELGREGLKQYGACGVRPVLDATGALWASVTDGWLTHRVPTGDATRSRWPVSAEWAQIQQAQLRDHAVPLPRIREAKRRASLRRLMPGLVGLLTAYGAARDSEDLDSVLASLPGDIRDYGIRSGKGFAERLAMKRRAFA